MSTKPDEQRWSAPIRNYYGRPAVVLRDGAWLLVLDNYDAERSVEVSETFAKAWIAQFPPSKPEPCWDCKGSGTWEPAPGWPDGCQCITCEGHGVLPEDEP